MELKHLNKVQKRKIVDFLCQYDNILLRPTNKIKSYNKFNTENLNDVAEDILNDYDDLLFNYENALKNIENLEDVISNVFGVLDYLIHNVTHIQELDIEYIIPSIKSVFNEDEIKQIERAVKLNELLN